MEPESGKRKLTPLPGAKLPVNPDPHAQQLAQDIEALTKAEMNTLTALNQTFRANQEVSEFIVVLLQDIRDVLVKVCQHTGMPLPKRLEAAIKNEEYNPDEMDDDDDEEEEEGANGESIPKGS